MSRGYSGRHHPLISPKDYQAAFGRFGIRVPLIAVLPLAPQALRVAHADRPASVHEGTARRAAVEPGVTIVDRGLDQAGPSGPCLRAKALRFLSLRIHGRLAL